MSVHTTDSRYAFGVVHDFGTLWKMRGFLTSTGQRINHSQLVANLLDAILLPTAISVCRCEAHTRAKNLISRGYRPAITVSHASPPTYRQAVNKICIIDRASPTLLSPHHVMPGMTRGETVAKTSSLSTNDTQLVHRVSSLLPSHSVIPPRVPM